MGENCMAVAPAYRPSAAATAAGKLVVGRPISAESVRSSPASTPRAMPRASISSSIAANGGGKPTEARRLNAELHGA